jgi:predicted Zn-dependent protease/Flp pilus assembly protein TadD
MTNAGGEIATLAVLKCSARESIRTLLKSSAFAALFGICALAASPLLAQEKEYFVGGKKVAESVYRAATLTNDSLPLIEANRLEEAKEKLVDALRLAPDFSVARYDLGVVLMKQGDDDAAAIEFAAVISTGAEVPEAWVSLAGLQCNRGRCADALAILDDATRRFPVATWEKTPEYYFNRGLALGRLGRSGEAIEQLKRALSTRLVTGPTLLNLAALYQGTGKLEESIAHYNEYLRQEPQNPDAPVIVDLIKSMEEELRQAKSLPTDAADDYFFAATQGGVRSWPNRSMPIRVFIHSGQHAVGFQPRYVDIVKAAFEEWSAASQGRVRFTFTNNIRDAHMECLWTSDAGQLKDRSEGGEARVYYRDKLGIYDAQIFILTVPIMREGAVTERSIRHIALHEIGHALGLLGHSSAPGDVMYFSMPLADIERELSERDKKTLLRLYGRK